MIKTKVNFIFAPLILLFLIGCKDTINISSYSGVENFGYQLTYTSPFIEWYPDGKRSPYHFGLTSTDKGEYVSVDFIAIGNFDSSLSSIKMLLENSYEHYEIIDSLTTNQNGVVIDEFKINANDGVDTPPSSILSRSV